MKIAHVAAACTLSLLLFHAESFAQTAQKTWPWKVTVVNKTDFEIGLILRPRDGMLPPGHSGVFQPGQSRTFDLSGRVPNKYDYIEKFEFMSPSNMKCQDGSVHLPKGKNTVLVFVTPGRPCQIVPQ